MVAICGIFLQKLFFILYNHHQNFWYWISNIPSYSEQTRILMAKHKKIFFFSLMKKFLCKNNRLEKIFHFSYVRSNLVLQIYYVIFNLQQFRSFNIIIQIFCCLLLYAYFWNVSLYLNRIRYWNVQFWMDVKVNKKI